MADEAIINNTNDSEARAYQFWMKGEYDRAAELYEEAIAANPTEVSHYLHLGLMLLLQEKEAEAQMVWALVMSESEPDEVKSWTDELIEVLEVEADRQEDSGDDRRAWAIRQYIREFDAHNLNNLLKIIPLSIRLEIFKEDEFILPQIIKIIKAEGVFHRYERQLLQMLQEILDRAPTYPGVIELLETVLNEDLDGNFNEFIFQKTAYFINQRALSKDWLIKYAEITLNLYPQDIPLKASLASLYQNDERYNESVKLSESIIDITDNLNYKIIAYYLTIKGLLKIGVQWEKAHKMYEEYQSLLGCLTEDESEINSEFLLELMGTLILRPYFIDDPENTHQFRNKFAIFYEKQVKNYLNQGHVEVYQRHQRQSVSRVEGRSKSLRIGYLSSCFCRHSVGWIGRWLLKYHDRQRFDISAYSLRHQYDDVQHFIANQDLKFYDVSLCNPVKIAEAILQDKIDILVDIDSITHTLISPVLALKPAPIQVTWFGSDASGLPAVDYFVVDPYVLPESAQDYYTAKILRLPNVYLSVDGFEVGIPTLRRDELGIPEDAVIYYSGQMISKRHPDTARLQMKIIAAVQNSYFLIKSWPDTEESKNFFRTLAEEEGVKVDRLRFLSIESEEINRANLAIADVVLDTYPYNGATTTLETLWMGIPLVTRVGEQFAARNSYTMMMNVGVTEGIAWTDEEYMAWGIRLGKDADLRQQISGKLLRSRQTSPLWNAEQFTREMEKAYEQMWENYTKGKDC